MESWVIFTKMKYGEMFYGQQKVETKWTIEYDVMQQ